MEIRKVTDPEFADYGKVLEGYDFKGLIKALEDKTPCPEGTVYVGSCPDLEYTDAFGVLQNNVYGGMPIQIGYCNGHNTKLNCLEYHRDSGINMGTKDFILLLGKEGEIENGKFDNLKVSRVGWQKTKNNWKTSGQPAARRTRHKRLSIMRS